MYAAKFCYRCGRRFDPQDPGWCICGAERRHLQARPVPAPPPQPAEEEPAFQWVWCHFFRNVLVILAAICLIASAVTGTVAWLLFAFVLGYFARFIHVYHENVCKARLTRGAICPIRPLQEQAPVEGNGDTHD